MKAPKPPPPPDMKPLAEANIYASRLQYQAAQENRRMWQRQYEQVREDARPWRESGAWANQQLMQGMAGGGLRPVRWQGDAVQQQPGTTNPSMQMQFTPPPTIQPPKRIPKDTSPIPEPPPMPESIMKQFDKKKEKKKHEPSWKQQGYSSLSDFHSHKGR